MSRAALARLLGGVGIVAVVVVIVYLNQRPPPAPPAAPTGVTIVTGLPGSTPTPEAGVGQSVLGLPSGAVIHPRIEACVEEMFSLEAAMSMEQGDSELAFSCVNLYRHASCGRVIARPPAPEAPDAPDPRIQVLRACQSAYCAQMPHSDGSCTAPPSVWSGKTRDQWLRLHTHILVLELAPNAEQRSSIEAFAYLSAGLLHESVITATIE